MPVLVVEHALPQRLVLCRGEEQACHEAGGDGDARAPVNRGQQRAASGLIQYAGGDGNDEEGLDAFPQGDDQDLEHRGILSTRIAMRTIRTIHGTRQLQALWNALRRCKTTTKL